MNSGTKELALIKLFLQFLHHIWWRVQIVGLEQLPEQGPVFIVANSSGSIPWPALMLIYNLMKNGRDSQRHVNVLMNMDIIQDERTCLFLRALNCMPWSYDTAKRLLGQEELVVALAEDGTVALGKTIAMRNRLKRFDWTKFLPAIEVGAPIYPLATLGVDEVNIFPVSWEMRLMQALPYECVQGREATQEQAKKIALLAEGEIQAEINRLLREHNRK